jgi:hypothetical protein
MKRGSTDHSGDLSRKSSLLLQSDGKSEEIPRRRLGSAEGEPDDKGSYRRKIGSQMGRTLPVIKCHEKGAYHMVTAGGKPLLRAWNAEHLKKYYV